MIDFMKLPRIKVSFRDNVPASERPTVYDSRDVDRLIRPYFEDIEYRESAMIMLLNRANKVLGYDILSVGGSCGTVVDIKLLMQTVLECHACGLVLVHNHPSGNLTPSEADKRLTKKVKKAAALFDVFLLDHMILTAEAYFSFANDGLL